MDKTTGVPLSQVWGTLTLSQKLQVLLAMTRLQKQWLRVSFSHYGSLYYAGDVQSPEGNNYIKDGKTVMNSEFVIGPATGRDWMDAGRSALHIVKGPCMSEFITSLGAADKLLGASAAQYLHAVRMRETVALKSLKPPKQLVMFCGPKLYQPDTEKKLTALAWYQQIINALLPKDTIITNPYLWHNDLHENNIFINPHNPGEITAIIDWQACHISPLFNHNPTPAFIAWEDGPEPETLDLAPQPDLSELSQEEVHKTLHEYTVQNMFIGWRKLMHSKNPDMYQVVEFQKTAEYGLIFLAHRMFEYGEAHFQSLLVELKDTWADGNDVPFPFELSEADIQRIEVDSDRAVGGTDLLTAIKKVMGELWPDKGLIPHEQYDECKSALNEMKAQLIEQLAETDEDKAEYERCWPFD